LYFIGNLAYGTYDSDHAGETSPRRLKRTGGTSDSRL
jgi:hypothetical protein